MPKTQCFYCGGNVHQVGYSSILETEDGLRDCYASPEGKHVPHDVKNQMDKDMIYPQIAESAERRRLKDSGKQKSMQRSNLEQIMKDIVKKPPQPLFLDNENDVEHDDSDVTVKNSKYDAAYCAGCHSKFPISKGFPHTQSGETLIYCPTCSDDGELFGKQNGFSVSAAAPALDLTCDHCGEDQDPGDDNDVDFLGSEGDTCPECGHGKLMLAAKPDLYEGAEAIHIDETPDLTNDISPGMVDTTNSPRGFKPPRKMMRTQVDQLDKNNDGGGMQSMSYKIASYEDLRNHLIAEHGFAKHQIYQGYNAD